MATVLLGCVDVDCVFNSASPEPAKIDLKDEVKENLLLRFIHLCDVVYLHQIDQDLCSFVPDFENGNKEVKKLVVSFGQFSEARESSGTVEQDA